MSMWLCVFFCIISMNTVFVQCHIKFPGETYPLRVELEVNGSANITCQINPSIFHGMKNSSSLYFIQKDTRQRIPDSSIDIINDTTIVFMLRNASEQSRYYICMIDNNGIGMTEVAVGTVPLDVSDFTCYGYDYTYMVCTFRIKPNMLPTRYSLTYTAQSPYNLYKSDEHGKRFLWRTIYSQNYMHLCELEFNGYTGLCNLTTDRNNYRPNYKYYNFTLIGRNEVGTNTQTFWINHFESVIPPRPEYVLQAITTNSVELVWDIPKYSYYRKLGLEYEILLHPHSTGSMWLNHSDYEIRTNRSEYRIIVRNIPYAYFSYKIRLRIRVKANADNRDKYWSGGHTMKFRTEACLPDLAPKTDVGSFYIFASDTKVRLYWHQIPAYKENGPDFHYVISSIKRDDTEEDLQPLEIDRSSAVFVWNPYHTYEFILRSRNAIGDSIDNSTILVSAGAGNRYEQMAPRRVRNVYHADNHTYTLSWIPPKNQSDQIDYTVFWCHSKPAATNECASNIEFQHVSKDAVRFASPPQQQEQALNFAISANYPDFSSGMHWPMCTANVASDLVKLDPELLARTSRTITIEWSSYSVCSSILEGYNLTYCRLPNPLIDDNIVLDVENKSLCMDSPISKIIPSTERKFTINNLLPFSFYKIEIYMFSKLKKGRISEARVYATLEEAPTPPRLLEVHDITNASAILTWICPEQMNGRLTKYTIRCNSTLHTIDCQTRNETSCGCNMTYKLQNLYSYTHYTVAVTAHTTEASQPSNQVDIHTLVGIPSRPRHISTREMNRTVLQWSKPEQPSGRLDYYEVRITLWYMDSVQRKHISAVFEATECLFRVPECIDAEYRYTIDVRAINIERINASGLLEDNATKLNSIPDNFYVDNDDFKCISAAQSEASQLEAVIRYSDTQLYRHYASAWEKGPTYNCSSSKLNRITLFAFFIMLFVLAVVAFIYVLRKEYKKMSDISCTLPASLQTIANHRQSFSSSVNSDKKSIEAATCISECYSLLPTITLDAGSKCSTSLMDDTEILASSVAGSGAEYIYADAGAIDSYDVDSCTRGLGVTVNQNHHVQPVQKLVAEGIYTAMEAPTSPDETSPPSFTYENRLDGREYSDYKEIISLLGQKSTAANSSTTSEPPKQIPALIPSENGYIKPHNILNILKNSPSNVYSNNNADNCSVQCADEYADINASLKENEYGIGGNADEGCLRSKQPLADGYVTLDALNKTQPNAWRSSTAAANSNTEDNLPYISGYVTQKELSFFGQQH